MSHSFSALVMLLTLATAAQAETVYWVSPTGNDAHGGTRPEPNAEQTDGPFATLERAREAIRELKTSGGLPEGGVVVELRGGVYERDKAFELTADDSGVEGAPITYRARAGEEVRLVGGRVVTGFQPVSDPTVLERLLPEARGNVVQADLKALGVDDFGSVAGGGLELFFDDEPMTLARWPNEGFVRIVDVVGGQPFDVRGTKGDRVGRFIYEGDRPNRWTDETDAWMHGYWFWDWSDQRQRVESIDVENRIIELAKPYHNYGYRKGQWFYALNLLAELDSPGEWYLDRSTGVLYFWPPGSLQEGRPTVSVARSLVSMQDTSYVTLRGIVLESARGTAVTINGGTHCRIEACLLRNLGGWAVRIGGGTENGVVDCDVTQTADGGIALTGGNRTTLTPAGHYALNNHIHHYSRWNRMYRPAISLSGVGNRAAHNHIHHAPHMAISFGGNDHLMEFNEIHHVCQESNDAGAIYSGRDWTMRGTVVRHNYFHQITGFENRGCVGVYLDDMLCGVRIEGNVFHEVTRAAFIGGGRDCTVANNVFVDCKPALHIDARALGWASYHVATTMKQRLDAMPFADPPWSDRYPELLTLWDDEPAAPKGNLVARNVSFGGVWDGVQSQARPFVAFEDNLIDEDPRFVDAAGGNFQLSPDSPVFDRVPGFRRIPFDEIGLSPCDSAFRR